MSELKDTEIIQSLLDAGFFKDAFNILETTVTDHTKGTRNFALLEPAGSGLETVLETYFSDEKRIEMLKKGFLVTTVKKFDSPAEPDDVFRQIFDDAKTAIEWAFSICDSLKSDVTDEKSANEWTNFMEPEEADSPKHFRKDKKDKYNGTPQDNLIKLVDDVYAAGYRIVFVYTDFENLVFADFKDPPTEVGRKLGETLGVLFNLSTEEPHKACFVVTTPYGMKSPYLRKQIYSSFFDRFETWTYPRLEKEWMEKVLKSALESAGLSAPKNLCYDHILTWTGGNATLIHYFFKTLCELGGDLKKLHDFGMNPTGFASATSSISTCRERVNSLLESWYKHLTDKQMTTLELVASAQLQSAQNEKETEFLEKLGLIWKNETDQWKCCSTALKIYLLDKMSAKPQI